MWPNLAALEMDRVDEVWDRRIGPDLPGYMAQRCERFLGDLLRHDPIRTWLGFEPVTIGKYWDRNAELDLVALDRDGGNAVIAEVKWTARPIGPDVARRLHAQADSVESLRCLNKRFVLFSRAGFTESLRTSVPDDLYLVDLARWPATTPPPS